jgi:hypothetical protein
MSKVHANLRLCFSLSSDHPKKGIVKKIKFILVKCFFFLPFKSFAEKKKYFSLASLVQYTNYYKRNYMMTVNFEQKENHFFCKDYYVAFCLHITVFYERSYYQNLNHYFDKISSNQCRRLLTKNKILTVNIELKKVE